jgi:hypothetical protein
VKCLLIACALSSAAIAAPLERILDLPTPTPARLRIDTAGRPYVITPAAIVPIQRLASGEPARPFRVAGAAAIEDAAWVDDVLLLIVGRQLGTIDDRGFVPIVALPVEHMRIAAASADSCWLFANDRLYKYTKGSTALVETLHAPGAIGAVSGSYVAIGGSLVRRTDLVFDGDDPILAVAETPTGAIFSTRRGVFALVGTTVSQLAAQPALAIAIHGDDVFLQLDGVGIVHTLVPQPPPPAATISEPEVPRPPDRATFIPPTGPNDFRDLRFSITTGISSTTTVADAPVMLDGAWTAHVQRVWGRDVPGVVWSLGLELDRSTGNVAHTGSTLYNMAGTLGVAYGIVVHEHLQLEIGPRIELDGAALDQPFSSATAWGNGWGIAGVLAIHYVLDSGNEIGATATYGLRNLYLSGDCTPCTAPGFDATISTTIATLGLSFGRRY